MPRGADGGADDRVFDEGDIFHVGFRNGRIVGRGDRVEHLWAGVRVRRGDENVFAGNAGLLSDALPRARDELFRDVNDVVADDQDARITGAEAKRGAEQRIVHAGAVTRDVRIPGEVERSVGRDVDRGGARQQLR